MPSVFHHLCFDCTFNKQVEGDETEMTYRCEKGLVLDWNVGSYTNVMDCEKYEQVGEEEEGYGAVNIAGPS